MNKTLDLRLTQKTNLNFVIYDASNRGYLPNNYIEYNGSATKLVPTGGTKPYIYYRLTKDNIKYKFIIADTSLEATLITFTDVFGDTISTVPNKTFDFANIIQDDFEWELTYEDNGIAVSEGTWYVYYKVLYYDVNLTALDVYSKSSTVLSFKECEIYRAKLFEMISRNRSLFDTIEQRVLTEFEVDVMGLMVYDAYYKALITALESNSITDAAKMLTYMQNYKTLNPIIP